MNAQPVQQWEQLIDEFKGFGGTVNNVVQLPGPFGLGLFPIKPGQPSELRVPQHLLIPVHQIALQDGVLTLKNTKSYPKGYADWFSNYQANFSWGAEAKQTIQNFEYNLNTLPSQILKQLSSLGFKTRDKTTNTSLSELALRFIKTRQILHPKGQVIMPILELVNHAPHGKAWEMNGDGIAINGKFNDEILIRYSTSDPLNRLMQYGFNCQEPTGFSVNLRFSHRDHTVIVNGGINNRSGLPCESFMKNKTLLIIKPLLGTLEAPRMPRTLFRESLKNFKIDADELFDRIQHFNRMAIINLLKGLGGTKGIMSRQLRTACLDQLVSLSCHAGSRKPN